MREPTKESSDSILKGVFIRGVSVVICTNRTGFVRNIMNNFQRQKYPEKEMIIILNNNKIDMDQYVRFTKQYPNVSVYRMDERISLGKCLNFAVRKSKYPFIAKFDDDDYYGSYYLHGIMACFQKTGSDIVGKRACFVYLQSKRLLLLLHPNQAHCQTEEVMGSTLSFRREVFRKVQFKNVSRGEDTYFFQDCITKKLKIHACGPYNYVCIRRPNRMSHTWQVDEQELLNYSRRIQRTSDFTKFVNRPVGLSNKRLSGYHGP